MSNPDSPTQCGTLSPRRKTRRVQVGPVAIGGDAPVSIQSMTNTQTRDAEATLAQVHRLVEAGCDIVRVTAATPADTAALPAIVAAAGAPIVADVHFHFERALEAVAAGVHKIRLNPGNITDRRKVQTVIDACRDAGVAIRVGVNAGSVLERRDKALRSREMKMSLVDLMVAKLCDYVEIFRRADFHDLVLAVKSPDVPTTIEANRRIADLLDYPIHLGVTHAGDEYTGLVKSCAAMGALLAEGIGDTLRISLAADPVAEVAAAAELLASLNLRKRRGAEIIACPTCGRIRIDLPPLVAQLRRALGDVGAGLKVAVMGCVVNGPGEAEDAHIAVCGGDGKGVIYVDGRIVQTVPEQRIVEAVLEEVRRYVDR